MFLRFVTERRVELTGSREGIFHATRAMREDVETFATLLNRVAPLTAWFNENLDAPGRFGRTGSKGHYRRETAGLSWFKPSATEHIERAILMSDILREYGYPVTMLKTRKPGFIVYEDEWQIVAEPFADTPR